MRNTLTRTAAVAVALAGAAGVITTATPAQATPTCSVTVRQVTVNGVPKTRLSIYGKPSNSGRVYSFRLTWGWTNTVSTYIPTYRTYYAPRHTPLSVAKGWVNGYRCTDWNSGVIF